LTTWQNCDYVRPVALGPRAFAVRDKWIREVGLDGVRQPNSSSPVTLRSASSSGRRLEWQVGPQDGQHNADEAQSNELIWRARESPIRCALRTTVPDDFPIVMWTPTLTNPSESTTEIYEDWCSLDILLGDGEPIEVSYSYGSLATVEDYAPKSRTLRSGDQLRLQPGGGRSSSEVLPFFLIELGDTSVVIAVAWTGEWFITFDLAEDGLRVRAGVDRTRFKMLPGEHFTGPGIALMFWTPDFDISATNLWRRYLLAHHRPRTARGPVRPGLSCATWGATSEQVHLQVIEQLEEEKLPFERYWIDAGWFGDEPHWFQNVGTWTANSTLWPDGFATVAARVHDQGKKFLLWFEPERVASRSKWYRDHPEWLLRIPEDKRIEPPQSWDEPEWVFHYSRHTGNEPGETLFDLGNAEAREFLIDFISGCISEWGIDVYRQDFNFAPLEFWNSNDDEDRVGVTQLKYIEGLCNFLDELIRRHPDLEIDNCASGGRRLDLSMIGRATTLTRSDYLRDPVGHQCHNYGLSTWIPMHATLTHAGFDPYALRSAYTGGLSVSWATGFNEPETGVMDLDFEKFRDRLVEFETVRDYFLGDFYPLTPYTTSEAEWLAYQFHDPSRDAGVALAFRRQDCDSTSLTVRLSGLTPDSHYYVQIEHQPATEIPGSDLATGLTLHAREAPASVLVTYTRTAETTR
jgi:alpha-galactosidase